MSGKGDSPRPLFVERDTYAANWFITFRPCTDATEGTLPNVPLDRVVPDRSTRAGDAVVRRVQGTAEDGPARAAGDWETRVASDSPQADAG